MASKIYRLTIQLSEAEFRLLEDWSNWHGRPRSTFASQIIGSRLATNSALIKELVRDEAERQEITIQELRSRWAAKGNTVELQEDL